MWYSMAHDQLMKLICDITDFNSDIDPTARQARAVFTTICITLHIEADTSKSDMLLGEMYEMLTNNVIIDYSDFKTFMLADIV